MARMENLEALQAKLAKRAEDAAKDQGSWIVGFTQAYAIYVHEDMEAKHPVGQAKFLEQPARELSGRLSRMVGGLMRQGYSMMQAIMVAALGLQRAAQVLCPVDTSALKNSAFTRQEETK